MGIVRVDSIYDMEAIGKEHALLKEYLGEDTKALIALYEATKGMKTTTITTFAKDIDTLGVALDNSKKKQTELTTVTNSYIKAQQSAVAGNNAVTASYKDASGTIEQNIQLQLRYKKSLDDLKQEQKDLSASLKAGTVDGDTFAKKQIEIAKAIEEVKQGSTELQRTIRLQVKEQNAASGSLDEMKAQYDRLFQIFRGLSDEEQNSDFGTQLNKDLGDLSNTINTLQKSAGNYSGNVGRYEEATQKIIDSINAEEAKLNELEKTRIRVSNAGAGSSPQRTQVTGFGNITGSVTGDTTGGISTPIQNTATDIKTLDQQITQSRTVIEGFRKELQDLGNVPNSYQGEFTEAYQVIVKQLSDLRTKLATTGKDTPGFDKLVNEEKLLTQLTGNLAKAFKNPTQELRAFQNTAKALGQEFGLASDEFNDFVKEVGDKKNELDDIQATVNFNASDTKYLDGIVSAVNGVVGAYGAFESATVLLGADNEELQKSMQKLQAILTLVTSLQAVLNAVQTESGAVQVALAAKTGLLNAAKAIQAALSTTNVAATQSEVIANTELALAAQATTTALGEQAIATDAAAVSNVAVATTAEGAATALGGEAVAAESAAVATSEFSTVLIASGVGALILAIAAGVVYLIAKIKDWNAATALNSDQQKELTATLLTQYDTIKKLSDLIVIANKNQKDALQQQLSAAEALGENAYKIFGIKQKIAALDKKTADEQKAAFIADAEKNYPGLKGLAALQKSREDNLLDYRDFVKSTESLTQGLIVEESKADKTRNNDLIESLKKEIENRNGSADALKKSYDDKTEAIQKATDAENAITELSNQQEKFSADERRKLLLESAHVEADIVTSKNNLILANEKSTQEQRIEAIKSNAAEQRKVIAAELQNVTSNPTSSATDITLAQKKAAADSIKLTGDTNKSIEDVNESYRKRRLAAELETNKLILDQQINLQDQILSNSNISLANRLSALAKYTADSQKILDEDYAYTKATNVLTDEELIKLDADYHAKTVALAADALSKKSAIIKAEHDLQKELRDDDYKDTERGFDQLDALRTAEYNNQVIKLNDVYAAGKLSQEEYNKARLDIDKSYSKDSIAIEIDRQKKLIDQLDYANKLKVNLEAELQQATDAEDNAKTDQEKIAAAKRIQLIKDELKATIDTIDKESALYKQLSELLKKLSDEQKSDSDIKKERQLKNLADIKAGFDDFATTVDGILNAVSERRKNQIADERDALDASTADQIANVEKSVDSEQNKADKIAQINASAANKKAELDRQEKQADIEKAKFDKVKALFEIAINTATAVVKDLGNPFKVAFDIIFGAAQAAIVLATPIPHYKMGRGLGKEENAILNDGGVQEYIHHTATGEIETPTGVNKLVHLMPTDKVYKDKQTMIRAIGDGSPALSQWHVNSSGNINRNDLAEFAGTIVKGMQDIQVHSTTITKDGWRTVNRRLADKERWVNEVIRGK